MGIRYASREYQHAQREPVDEMIAIRPRQILVEVEIHLVTRSECADEKKEWRDQAEGLRPVGEVIGRGESKANPSRHSCQDGITFLVVSTLAPDILPLAILGES